MRAPPKPLLPFLTSGTATVPCIPVLVTSITYSRIRINPSLYLYKKVSPPTFTILYTSTTSITKRLVSTFYQISGRIGFPPLFIFGVPPTSRVEIKNHFRHAEMIISHAPGAFVLHCCGDHVLCDTDRVFKSRDSLSLHTQSHDKTVLDRGTDNDHPLLRINVCSVSLTPSFIPKYSLTGD